MRRDPSQGSGPLHPRRQAPVARQDRVERNGLQLARLHHHASFHHQRVTRAGAHSSRAETASPAPLYPTSAQIEQRDVGALARLRGFRYRRVPGNARLPPSPCAAPVRHVSAAAPSLQPLQQQRLARLRQHVRTIVGCAAIHAQTHRTAGLPQTPAPGRSPTPAACSSRTVRDPDAGASPNARFPAIKEDAVRQPRIATHPADVLQQIERPLSEPVQAIRLFIACLGQVRVQPHAVRPANAAVARINWGETENGEHGASATRSMAPCRAS